MRRAVAALAIRQGEARSELTVSIGVAAHRGATSLEKLMLHADAALYRAKAAGRNRVELAPTLMMARVERVAPSAARRKFRAPSGRGGGAVALPIGMTVAANVRMLECDVRR